MRVEYQEHLDALKAGLDFMPKLTGGGIKASLKRKNKRVGKKGSPKHRKILNYHPDDDDVELPDSEADDSDSDSEDSTISGSDDEPSDEEEDESATVESIEAKLNQTHADISNLSGRLLTALHVGHIHRNKLKRLADSFVQLQREKNAFCSLKRSEFTKNVVQRDFRAGLKDMDGK